MKNLKHQKFADEYLSNGLNATDAYRKVYPKSTDESARRLGSKLLTKVDVKSYISNQQAISSANLKVDREFIVNEYIELINSAKQEGLDGAGTIKDRSNWAKSLGQLSKLLGLDAPEQKEIKHSGDLSIKNLLDFDED